MNELTNLVSNIFANQAAVSKAALKVEKELEDYRDSLFEDCETYPTCDWCGEAITEDWYEIDAGKTVDIVCPECIAKCRKERT